MKRLILAALLSAAFATPAIAAKYIPAASAPVAKSSTAPAATTAATPVAQPRPAVTASPPAVQPAPARAAPAATNYSAFYVGAQVGDSTIGAMLGYQFSRMYAMEFSYDYVDPVRTPTTTLATSRIGASGLAMFPIKFSEMGPMAIYIKVGYARTTDIYTVEDPGTPPFLPATTSVTTTIKTGVTGGAGVQVDLSKSSTARLGVNYVGGDRSVYLAAMYKF